MHALKKQGSLALQHAPLHAALPPGQPQAPLWHAAPDGHLWPQAPQLALLLATSVQTPLHTPLGAAHLQLCATHASPVLQELPQAPQLAKLPSRLTQDWPHLASPVAQAISHLPLLQN